MKVTVYFQLNRPSLYNTTEVKALHVFDMDGLSNFIKNYFNCSRILLMTFGRSKFLIKKINSMVCFYMTTKTQR